MMMMLLVVGVMVKSNDKKLAIEHKQDGHAI